MSRSMTRTKTLTAPSCDVTDSFVASVLGRWRMLVYGNMDRDWETLIDCEPWLFMESMHYLMNALLAELGVAIPLAVSFSFMNSITEAGDCEMLLVWGNPKGGHFDPYNVVKKCTALRLDEFVWPSRFAFLSNDTEKSACIKQWAWTVSLVVKDMPKGD